LADIQPIIYIHIHIWQYPTTIPTQKKIQSNEINMTLHTHIWEQSYLNILLVQML